MTDRVRLTVAWLAVGLALLLAAATPLYAQPVSQNNQTQTYSAFTKTGRGTDISATAVTSRQAIVAGPVAVVHNTGAVYAYVAAGGSAVTVTATSGIPVPPGSCAFLNAIGATYVAGITASGSATLQIVTGTGIPGSCGGGGSGGGGGGGSVTQGTDPWLVAGKGIAGTPSGGVMTVQGVVSGVAFPVTGTFWQATQPVSLASVPSHAVTVALGGLALGAGADGWDATQGAKADAVCPTPTGALCSVIALLKYANNTAPILGAGSALVGDMNLRQGGTALSPTNGAYFNPLQGNAVLSVSNPSFAALAPTTTQGCTSLPVVTAAASTNAASVKASAGTVCDWSATNEHTSVQYVHFYNTAGTPTCNAGIISTYAIPPASAAGQVGGFNRAMTFGRTFATGIGYCITASRDGTGSATANGVLLNIGYK